eukprot:TRINITY_DN89656_c1_g1_i1.p1 TRINITY_DN89656_c1_g1~~TRINITY_DN89656_c1_g1_i1.p1  ORF type:complete len:507 (-),score=55.97 TRINITY_DN89656_c1_g1_i1:77-1507(-)
MEEDKWDCSDALEDVWEEAEQNLTLQTAKSITRSVPYAILTPTEVEEKLKGLIQDCAEMFQIPFDEATIILIHYGWNWEKLQAEWFLKEAAIRTACGIPKAESKDSLNKECPVCFEDLDPKLSDYLKCNHAFCPTCWKGHLLAQVSTGKSCLLSKCPYPKCQFRVGPSFFKKYLSEAEYARYQKYLLLSFTDDNKVLKWCPGAGCGFVVECTGPINLEVTCKCGCAFCFSCLNESHLPVPCETYKKWMDKNTSESENVVWIKANTKPCPKCKRAIEKNQGCNHMTCSQCKYEFCWICMGDWKAHNGNYNCNKINKELWSEQKNAKDELQRYMFYFERYENHRKAIKKAEEEKEIFREFAILMNSVKAIPFVDTNFLYEALKTLKDVRRVLSNSYIFGYYLNNVKEVQLFEFMQQNLEINCEMLHEMVERKKDEFLNVDDLTNSSFFRYKSDLTNMCNVITKFYEKFVDGIKYGLVP